MASQLQQNSAVLTKNIKDFKYQVTSVSIPH